MGLLDKAKKRSKHSSKKLSKASDKKAKKSPKKTTRHKVKKAKKRYSGPKHKMTHHTEYHMHTVRKKKVKRPKAGDVTPKEEHPVNKITRPIKQKMVKIKDKVLSPRAATGIPNLDPVIEGGFLRNSIVMLAGGAGSGKSILSMQYLIAGIEKFNETGVFITFEESEEQLKEDFEKFGWDIDEKIKNKQLVILNYTPEQVEKVLESGGGTIRDTIESIKAKRLVIDSLTAFNLLSETETEEKTKALTLFKEIRKWNCTAILTEQHEPDPEKHKEDIMEYEVETVLLLYNERKGDVRERSLEVFKMRGSQHTARIFPIKITDKGIVTYPEETVF